MVLALYGTVSTKNTKTLDIISVCFLISGLVEISFRILCFGWRDFWYINDDFFHQCANRWDFYINSLTLGTIVIAIISKQWPDDPNPDPMVLPTNNTWWFNDWIEPAIASNTGQSNDWTRLILAVPLLRAFSTIRLIRDIVMGMMTVFPQYLHVFTLLGVVFYFYAALGCLLFASDFKYNQSYEIPDANFNSMLDSLITLFQLFVGEAWNDILQAGLNTGKTVQALSYFVSYSILMTMLFTNLLIGIICSGYESISDVRKEHQEAKIPVSVITSALKEGETTNRRLQLIYNRRGTIFLRRTPEYQAIYELTAEGAEKKRQREEEEEERKDSATMLAVLAVKNAGRKLKSMHKDMHSKKTML